MINKKNGVTINVFNSFNMADNIFIVFSWIHTITSLFYFILTASCAQQFLLPDECLVVVKCLIFISISYPDSPPEVYVSANDLTRSTQDLLNSTLQDYMASVLVPGECCLLLVVDWVREHAQSFLPPVRILFAW